MLYAVLGRQDGLQCRIGYALEQDPAENTTVIRLKTVEMNAQTPMGAYWVTGALTVGGKKVWGYDSWYAQVYLGTGWNRAGHCPEGAPEVRAEHAPDGTCSIRFAVRFTFGSAGSSYDYTASASVELPAIPRTSLVEVGAVTLGQPAELRITRAAEQLAVSLRWRCGRRSETIAEKTMEDSILWVLPLSLADQQLEGDTLEVILEVTSWSGDTEFGASEQTVLCRIPEELRPEAELTVSDLTDCRERYGDFLELRSLVQVQTLARGCFGSRITKIEVWCGNLNGTGEQVRFRISGSGQIPITVAVTDSRGRTAQTGCTIRVIPCRRPEITILQLQRCLGDGTPQPDGDHAAVTFSASVSPVGGQNPAEYFLQKKTAEGQWQETALTRYTGCHEVAEGQVIFPAGVNESYQVRLLVKDGFETTVCLQERLGAAFAMLDFDRSGLAIGIGQRAGDPNTVSLGLDMQMNTHRITGLPDPAAEGDAVNKHYVDALLGALARQLGIRLEEL